MSHGKIDEARNKVNAALAICPKFPEALTLRGMLEEDAGKSNGSHRRLPAGNPV